MGEATYIEVPHQEFQVLFIFVWVAALVMAFRWPILRGKHALCLFLLLGVAQMITGLLDNMATDFVGLRAFEVMMLVGQAASCVCLIWFVKDVGAELKRRQGREDDSP